MKYDFCFLENDRIFFNSTSTPGGKTKEFSYNRPFLVHPSPHIYYTLHVLFYFIANIYVCVHNKYMHKVNILYKCVHTHIYTHWS